MLESGRAQQRINIPYFEGVNTLVSFNIGKKTEFVHVENARSKMVGTIEKREGQVVLGTTILNQPFVATNNYGLFSFQNNSNSGFYRISSVISSTLAINVSDKLFIVETLVPTDLSVMVADSLNISEQINNNTGTLATIYYINNNSQWVPLTGLGSNIPGGTFSYTYAEGNIFLVNLNSDNRYITSDGTTVVTSSSAGHLYKTPPAAKINYYKNRLYLADYIQSGVRYKTTVLRSSYPLGIISLLNADYTNLASGSTIDVTDTKYFRTDSGSNTFDIYRGETFITTITVTTVNQTSIVATWTGTPTLKSSDEIWVSGTYGDPKVFRWINNPTTTGRDVKQYDTFKLSGGENDEITMFTNIGNVMLTANKNSLTSWNDYTLENFDSEIGCVSHKGYVKMLGTLYFLHYTGVYTTTGSTPVLISNKVEKYITGATKLGLESSAAGRKGRSVFFTLGDVTLYKLDGSLNKILKDVCLEYNITQQNWFVHTNVKAGEFATFVEETNSDRLEFLDKEGNHSVKEFLSGETDDGEAIHFRVDTMKLTTQTNNFEYSSKLIALLAEAERGSAVQVFVNLENSEEYYALEGSITKGLSVVKMTDKDANRGKPPYCRLVSISLRDSSKQICKINRMTVVYLPTTDENMDNE